jgi:hypothetical protein
MQKARIFQQPKSAMQSGRAKDGGWTLRFEPLEAQRLDPLTGWPGSGDTKAQVKLSFPTAEAAAAWCAQKGIDCEIERAAPIRAEIKPKSYADNFRFGRVDNWSH